MAVKTNVKAGSTGVVEETFCNISECGQIIYDAYERGWYDGLNDVWAP
jgi:hypothetical protein